MTTLAVLDIAGTTVRDDGAVVAAFGDAFAALGIEPTTAQRRYVLDTMGRSKIEVFGHLLDDDAAARAANAAFETAYARRVDDGDVVEVPGALDAIRRMRSAGIRVCLVTGFSPRTRDALLARLGWTDEVDLALSPSHLVRGRPTPDLVLAAALRLSVDDVRDIAVAGDTTNDLLSGFHAGAGVVAGVLTGAHDRALLGSAPHTHLLEDVTHLPAALGLS